MSEKHPGPLVVEGKLSDAERMKLESLFKASAFLRNSLRSPDEFPMITPQKHPVHHLLPAPALWPVLLHPEEDDNGF